MTAFEIQLDKLRIASKRTACLTLLQKIQNECMGLDSDGWAFKTGQIFGEFMKELDSEEKQLPKADLVID